MKKGLLSLLVVTLTVVGCQNYDDQFQELTEQIEGLETQIDGLPDLTSQVTQLQTTVNGLQTALTTVGNNVVSNGTAIAANTAAIAGVQSGVDANGTAIASNGTAIASNGTAIAGVQGDVTTISANVVANGTAIAGVQGDVTTISANVIANGTAITSNGTAIASNTTAINDNGTAIAANGVDIAALSSDLADAQADISQILADLAAVATTADLMLVSSALADVQADVTEILNGTASVNQAISLTNALDTAYANGLILTGAGAPSAYIINNPGGLTVDVSAMDASTLATATAIIAKIISVLGGGATVTSTAARVVSLTNLAYVQGNVTFGTEMPVLPSVATYDGNVILAAIEGDVEFTNKVVGGNVTLDASSVASITTLNFSGNTIGGSLTNSPLQLDNASLINVGTATVTGVIAPLASSITLGQTSNAAGLTVTATLNAASTISLGLTSSAGAITIVGSVTTLNLNALTGAVSDVTATGIVELNANGADAAGDISVTATGDVNLGGVETAGTIAITTAGDTDLSSLAAVNSDSSIGGVDVNLGDLASGTATLTLPNATSVSFAAFAATATVTADSATSITMKSANVSALSADAAASVSLTEQASSVSITQSASVFPSMTSLSVLAGASGEEQNGVTATTLAVTAATTLTTLAAGGKLDVVTATGAGLATVNTSGFITDLNLTGADIDTVDLQHSYIGLDTAPQIVVTGTSLTELNLSNIDKVKTIDVTGNTSLASITPPSSVLAEAGAPILVNTTGNSFTGTYTEGATGTIATQTIPARSAKEPLITSQVVYDLVTWYNLAAANSSAGTTATIELDNVTQYYERSGSTSQTVTASATTVSFDITDAWTADTYEQAKTNSASGTINTAAELATVTATATNY